MIIRLPFPNSKLNPNRNKGLHWAATSSLRKKARADAAILTKAAMRGNLFLTNGDIQLTITFVQPDKRHRDRDNLLAASKPMLDGVADALGINDAQFNPVIVKRAYGSKPGETIVSLAFGPQQMQMEAA